MGNFIMFILDRAFAYRALISHSSLTSKVAAGIVMGALLIVAIGTAYGPADELNSVDVADTRSMSATQMNGTPSGLLFTETDPSWSAEHSPGDSAPGIPPQESRDVEASMVNGHIQAF